MGVTMHAKFINYKRIKQYKDHIIIDGINVNGVTGGVA